MLEHPWWLLLLLLLPMFVWLAWRSDHDTTIDYSSASLDWHARPSWRQRLRWLPAALTFVALTLMILALARPRDGREQTIIDSEGIAIEMVVDRSGSMQALDFEIDGNHVDRLTAIKKVAGRFVLGADRNQTSAAQEDGLAGRASDLIGLIAFAGYADALTPPTLDHRFLVAQLDQLSIVGTQQEDGTAIGDAISLATDKLSSLDERQDEKVKSKVIILLTDGENTAGEIEPKQAAELAKALDVKIYTIGVGTNGKAPFPVRRSLSGRTMVQYVDVKIDEAMLKTIASITGGQYFRATDTESLEQIYDEIDRLEKTKVQSQQFVDYRELAVQDLMIGRWRMPPLLLIALWMLAARLLLQSTVFRRFG